MAMEFKELAPADNTPKVKLAQRTSLDANGNAVAGDSPKRVSLLGLEGDEVAQSVADAAGIPTGKLGEDKAPAKKPARKPAAKKPATKKRTPAKNKARTPARNK